MQKYDFLGTLNIKNILSTLNIKYIFKYTKILLFLLKYILVENVLKNAKKQNKQKNTNTIFHIFFITCINIFECFLFYLYRLTRCSLSLSDLEHYTIFNHFSCFPLHVYQPFPGIYTQLSFLPSKIEKITATVWSDDFRFDLLM